MGEALEFTMVVLSMIGAFVLSQHNRLGYLIMIFAFPFALGFAVYYQHWWQLCSFTFYFYVNCRGYFKWPKKIKETLA